MTESEWLEIFSTNLRELMEEQGYSQAELAKAIGVSQSTISRCLKGKQMPTIPIAINLMCELNCSYTDLIFFGDQVY